MSRLWLSEDGAEFTAKPLNAPGVRVALKAVAACEKMPDLHTLDGAEEYRLALVSICRSLCEEGGDGLAELSTEELQQFAGVALTAGAPAAEPALEAPPLSKRDHGNYRKALSAALGMEGCHVLREAKKYDDAMQSLLIGLCGESDDIKNVRMSIREEFLLGHLFANELRDDEGVTLSDALEGEGNAEGK